MNKNKLTKPAILAAIVASLVLIIAVLAIVAFTSGDSDVPAKNDDIQVDAEIDEAVNVDDSEKPEDEDTAEPEDEPEEEPPAEDEEDSDDEYVDPCVYYNIPIPTFTHTYDDGSKLILVNKQYAVTPDFYPYDMVIMNKPIATYDGIALKRDAYYAYMDMLADANAAGHEFKVCSGYRSYSTQEYLYFSYMDEIGLEATNLVSAYPGRSEHHTGWAIDITSESMNWQLLQSFIDYPEGRWINDHCHEYGFIVRYPAGKTHITGYSYEPWHLRYVGVDVATQIMTQGITLEEYLGVA